MAHNQQMTTEDCSFAPYVATTTNITAWLKRKAIFTLPQEESN